MVASKQHVAVMFCSQWFGDVVDEEDEMSLFLLA